MRLGKYLNHLNVYFTNKQAFGVGYAFVLMGALFGTWATYIPWIKQRFDINDAKLGLLLLSFPIGAALFNPVSAWLISKLNMRKATRLGMVFLPLAYCLPLNMPTISLIAIGLAITGMAVAQLNIAMNTCVAAIERNEGINIMSTSHGMFSIGLTVGSTISSISFGMDIDPRVHIITTAILFIVGGWVVSGIIETIKEPSAVAKEAGIALDEEKDPSMFRNLIMMVVISVFANMTEGCMADWTGVYMKEIAQASPYFIGWGLAGYSLLMAIGRFSGDGLLPVLGGKNLLLFGGVCVGLGLMICILFPSQWICILGFSIVGFGISFNSPVMYGSASRIPGMGDGKGLALLNSFGMIGFLGGPVIIGLISNSVGLKVAFGMIVCLAIIWSFLTRILKLY